MMLSLSLIVSQRGFYRRWIWRGSGIEKLKVGDDVRLDSPGGAVLRARSLHKNNNNNLSTTDYVSFLKREKTHIELLSDSDSPRDVNGISHKVSGWRE